MDLKVLSENNVKTLCGYIKKTYTQTSDFIDDSNVKTDGTYSSNKIENIKLELEQYSNNLINNIINVKTEIATIQPTLDNTIPNTIYLFEIDLENHIWNQYLRTENLLVDLGTTQIDLTDYVKNTDLTDYVKNTDLVYYKTVNDYNSDKGSIDISSIGDGTFTGAISVLNEKINNVATVEEIDTLFN